MVLVSNDTDPGVYYSFDRNTHELHTFPVVISDLQGIKLAIVKPINYAADDAVMVPGYLTLPHGRPGTRNRWAFNGLPQFYSSRGFAVLQPNYRGSLGFGDQWLGRNAFHSWCNAIGDVLDAGRWLVTQGVSPSQLAVVGWSCGGYAGLQTGVTDPKVFRAIVAIAPVTHLQQLKNDRQNLSDRDLVSNMIGYGDPN